MVTCQETDVKRNCGGAGEQPGQVSRMKWDLIWASDRSVVLSFPGHEGHVGRF